jgi:hypothetical protein
MLEKRRFRIQRVIGARDPLGDDGLQRATWVDEMRARAGNRTVAKVIHNLPENGIFQRASACGVIMSSLSTVLVILSNSVGQR